MMLENLPRCVESLRERAFRTTARIVLSDGTDARSCEAAKFLAQQSNIHLVLVGPKEEVTAALGGRVPDGMEVYDPARHPRQPELEELLRSRLRRGRSGGNGAEADVVSLARQPCCSAALLVEAGLADGMVGGASIPTAEVIRTGIRVVGLRPGNPVVSGAVAMFLRHPVESGHDTLVFADAAVIPDPTPEQLVDIAKNTADITRSVLGLNPVVAMLSFSTKGSAQGSSVSKVRTALKMLRAEQPDMQVDGELQADSALVPEVARRKAAGSRVAGRANVLIFPNLDAGNIAYKLVERVAGATALGVLLSGLCKPVNDLSRGCSPADIVNMVAVTALEAVNDPNPPKMRG